VRGAGGVGRGGGIQSERRGRVCVARRRGGGRKRVARCGARAARGRPAGREPACWAGRNPSPFRAQRPPTLPAPTPRPAPTFAALPPGAGQSMLDRPAAVPCAARWWPCLQQARCGVMQCTTLAAAGPARLPRRGRGPQGSAPASRRAPRCRAPPAPPRAARPRPSRGPAARAVHCRRRHRSEATSQARARPLRSAAREASVPSVPAPAARPPDAMVDGEECAKRVGMGFGLGAALGSSIGARGGAGRGGRAAAACARACASPAGPPAPRAHQAHATPPGAVYGTYGAFKYKARAGRGGGGGARRAEARPSAAQAVVRRAGQRRERRCGERRAVNRTRAAARASGTVDGPAGPRVTPKRGCICGTLFDDPLPPPPPSRCPGCTRSATSGRTQSARAW
jgi:hypothetical protein